MFSELFAKIGMAYEIPLGGSILVPPISGDQLSYPSFAEFSGVVPTPAPPTFAEAVNSTKSFAPSTTVNDE